MMDTSRTATKRELIIDVWEKLDCESVGATELKEIQREIRNRFGAGVVDSPASIARLLTDEGAVLRHPEVIDCDAEWRQQNLNRRVHFDALTFRGLDECAAWMIELDKTRDRLAKGLDATGLGQLAGAVQQIRQDCMLVAKSAAVNEHRRSETLEMADWLAIWLEQPAVFGDWLDLRRRSADFHRRFPEAVP